MVSVIGLGELACEIIDGFSTYPQYDLYKIATNMTKTKRSLKLEKFKTAEEYETKPPATKSFLKNVEQDVIFVCTGSEPECGASLRILENLKKKNITVFYLKKDEDLLSPLEKLQDKISINVLQQYARSGLFERIFLIDMTKVEEVVGDAPISEYYERQRQLITSTYHMLKVFQNSKPVMGNIMPSEDPNRISTLGQTEVGQKDDKWLFSLNKSFEKYYLYAINENILNSDKRLLSKIKEQVKSRAEEDTKVMFGIYPTQYEQNYVFCLANTKFIQCEESD